MEKEISVIIPTYQQGRSIAEVVAHLLAYDSGQLLEIIVADGGSDDGTVREAVKQGSGW